MALNPFSFGGYPDQADSLDPWWGQFAQFAEPQGGQDSFDFSAGMPAWSQPSQVTTPSSLDRAQQPSGINFAGSSQMSGASGRMPFSIPSGGVYGQSKWLPGSTGTDIFLPRNSPITAETGGQVLLASGGNSSPMGAPPGEMIVQFDDGTTARFRHVQPQVQGRFRPGQLLGVISDSGMDMLSRQVAASIGAPDGYQHLDLSINRPGNVMFSSQGGGGGDLSASQWLSSMGYQGRQVGRTPGPQEGMAGGGAGFGAPMGFGGGSPQIGPQMGFGAGGPSMYGGGFDPTGGMSFLGGQMPQMQQPQGFGGFGQGGFGQSPMPTQSLGGYGGGGSYGQMPQMQMPQAQPQLNITGYNNVSAARPQGGLGMAQQNQQVQTPYPQPGQGGQAPPVLQNGRLGGQAPGTSGTQGYQPQNDQQTVTNALEYGPDNPVQALNFVMQDMGRNPYNAGNLVAQFLKRAAPGLAAAFNISNASNGDTTGSPSQLDPGGAFKQFLMQHLGSSDVFSTLHGAANTLMGDVIPKYRALTNGGGAQNLQDVNPALQALGQALSANGGAGTGDILTALLGPTMSKTGLSGLQSGFEQAEGQGLRSYLRDYQQNPQTSSDIWTYLLGL